MIRIVDLNALFFTHPFINLSPLTGLHTVACEFFLSCIYISKMFISLFKALKRGWGGGVKLAGLSNGKLE